VSEPILIAGGWRRSTGGETFSATNPSDGEPLGSFPVSTWSEIDEALDAGAAAFDALQDAGPEGWADLLRAIADEIEAAADELVRVAHEETALPVEPRLRTVELPRTTDQLRRAADAAVARAWREPVLAPEANIGAYLAPIPGVAVVFGPNNFPFAFNGIAGGDFAAALATGHPILAKANPGHPGTTLALARCVVRALETTRLPAAAVQLVYHMASGDGLGLVADPRVAATAFTGSAKAGLALKRAADAAGKPIFLEMSSVNPVVVLPGAWAERGEQIADQLAESMSLALGQFCTSPGLLFATGDDAGALQQALIQRFGARTPGPLLGPGVVRELERAVAELREAGAEVAWTGAASGDASCRYPTTLLRADARRFLQDPAGLQREAFGNAALLVSAHDEQAVLACLSQLEGNLTGTVMTATDGSDDEAFRRVARVLRPRVGRLLQNKPPTGVAVVPSMNHGGPYPATGHPAFTAVGVPASLKRFTMLQSFDNVEDRFLPPELQAANPLKLQRFVDGRWTDETL
jgi:NADP-dependent aldehyde dehydrogenase